MAEHPGKIRFVVRDFPLESIHENAFKAALAANAAHSQGKFFEFTQLLYTRQDALDAASLSKYAAEVGLNVKQFEIDSKSEKTAAEVRNDIADGEANSINSTPTIFVNGVRVRNLSLDGLRYALERALAK
jgi:protein-disulfide isomerase